MKMVYCFKSGVKVLWSSGTWTATSARSSGSQASLAKISAAVEVLNPNPPLEAGISAVAWAQIISEVRLP